MPTSFPFWRSDSGNRARRKSWSCWILLLVALAATVAGSAADAADLKVEVSQYVAGGGTLGCESLYESLKGIRPQEGRPANGPAAERWYWPAFFYLSARCGRNPSYDAPSARTAAEGLFARKEYEAALLTVLLGSYCYIQSNQSKQMASALQLIEWSDGRRAPGKPEKSGPWLTDRLNECRVFSSLEALRGKATSLSSRPTIVVAPFDVGQVEEFRQDPSAAAAALTWLVLESMQRVVVEYPLPSKPTNQRVLSVDEDLALRTVSSRLTSVTTAKDASYMLDGMKFPIPSYLLQIREAGKTFIAGYLTSNRQTVLSYEDEDAAAKWLGEVSSKIDSTGLRTGSGELQRFPDMPGLALRAALDILSNFPTEPGTPVRPGRDSARETWRVLPKGQRLFFLLTEAVGFEIHGNYYMAARRYGEIMGQVPPGTPPSELSFVNARWARCNSLLGFDDPVRFLANNDETLRRLLSGLVGG
jgi:hypothetical protein